MPTNEVSIDIAAPADRVWAIMSDVERWPEWTASVTSVELLDGGPFGVGSRARVRQPRLPTTVWRVTQYEPGRFFEWQAKGPGTNVVAGHRVEPNGTGSRATLSIDQGGVFGALFGLIYKKLTREYMDMEAAGLKLRSETG